jgi:hypothetical protein
VTLFCQTVLGDSFQVISVLKLLSAKAPFAQGILKPFLMVNRRFPEMNGGAASNEIFPVHACGLFLKLYFDSMLLGVFLAKVRVSQNFWARQYNPNFLVALAYLQFHISSDISNATRFWFSTFHTVWNSLSVA